MHILIVGAGKFGYSLAEKLVVEGHSVVMLDKNPDALRRADSIDVLCVEGNGANAAALREAGADRTDVVVAATQSDETNMLCCLLCKRMGTQYAIARIRDPEYADSLQILQHDLSIDKTVNPDRATALEISRIMRYPYATELEYFAKGRIEMVAFRAREGDCVTRIPLSEIGSRCKGIPNVLYAVCERGDSVMIPNGNFVIKPGDKVYVVAETITVKNFFDYLGRETLQVKNVMLLGGGRIAYYLARELEPMGISVNLIEINEERAETLSAQLPSANIILGDGTDIDLLRQESLDKMDVFVTLTGRDEENLILGMLALRFGTPKVIVKNSRINYADVLGETALEGCVSPKEITASNVLRYVRSRANVKGTKIHHLYRLLNGKAEALEFIARKGDSYIGIPLRMLRIRDGSLIACIVRNGCVIVPFGNDTIESGDAVLIITTENGITDLSEVIHR